MVFDESILIRTAASEVFKTISNVRNYKKFVSIFQDGASAVKGPLELGSEFSYTLFFLGRKYNATSVVVEIQQDTLLAYETTSSPVPSKVRYEMERVNDHVTRVRLHYEVFPGSFFQLEESFLRPRMVREVTSTLRGLKELVESKVVKA